MCLSHPSFRHEFTRFSILQTFTVICTSRYSSIANRPEHSAITKTCVQVVTAIHRSAREVIMPTMNVAMVVKQMRASQRKFNAVVMEKSSACRRLRSCASWRGVRWAAICRWRTVYEHKSAFICCQEASPKELRPDGAGHAAHTRRGKPLHRSA